MRALATPDIPLTLHYVQYLYVSEDIQFQFTGDILYQNN